MKRKGKIVIVSILIFFSVPILFMASVNLGLFGRLQSKKELLDYKNANASVVLSQEGKLIGKIFSENRTNISYRQIPAHLINALVATEDARFFEHEGIDSRSLLRVLLKTVLFSQESSGGGSTITQQLAKNMFGRNNTGPFAIFINKTKEAFLAHRLEKILSKEEILTLYLNTVSFGENVYGIEAASGRYFNKKVELLTIEESAVLVGILKANNFYNPRLYPENAKNRRNVVLNQMKKYNYLGTAEADSLCLLPLVQDYSNLESKGPADYFLYQVTNDVIKILQEIQSVNGKEWNIEEDGLVITTTLNLDLQNYANQSFQKHLSLMQKRLNDQFESAYGRKFIEGMTATEIKKLNLTGKSNEVADSIKQALKVLHAGLIALHPVTGAVKAWVGGIDFRTHPYDQILARRQLASTFKPILYAAALEDGIRPCQYLDNDSIALEGFEDYSPENFDHSYGGKYSLTGALVHSMNIPTFNLFLKVGFGSLNSLWKKMNFSFPLTNIPSLAMGTAEATISEVAVAYSSFANGGFKIVPHKIVSIRTADGELIWEKDPIAGKERILSESTSRLISAILQKAVREGTGASLKSVYGVTLPMAGKTGTSQDYADAWFTVFNPSLVIVTRVGASYPAVHFNNGSYGSGSTLALPLVALTLRQLQMNHELSEQLISPFRELTPELSAELDCPDFKEDNVFDEFIDIFKKDKKRFENDPKAGQKKKTLLQRIFGTKDKSRR